LRRPVFFSAKSAFDLMTWKCSADVPSIMASPRLLSAAGLVAEIDRLTAMCAEAEAERRRLIASLERYADENAALRASALLWSEWYERQLRRANALADEARAHSCAPAAGGASYSGVPREGEGFQGMAPARDDRRSP
jgi:hypothetical protein